MASPDSPILSPERKEHFDELVDQGLWGQISAELADLPPADVAELLSHYGEDSLARLFECLPAEIKPDVLAELPADLAAGLAAAMPAADAADIVNEMAPDDAADVLGELDDKEVSSKIIEGMDDENADDVSRLMTYPEDSAGGIMTTDLVQLHPDQTVNEALDAIEQEIADQIPATFRDKFTALRYLNMLGNFKTQVYERMQNAGIKSGKVFLHPLMSINGDHGHNDMGGDDDDNWEEGVGFTPNEEGEVEDTSWKKYFEHLGYECNDNTVLPYGLLELPTVRQVWINHTQNAIDGEPLDYYHSKNPE